jgi:hypothetical protein
MLKALLFFLFFTSAHLWVEHEDLGAMEDGTTNPSEPSGVPRTQPLFG